MDCLPDGERLAYGHDAAPTGSDQAGLGSPVVRDPGHPSERGGPRAVRLSGAVNRDESPTPRGPSRDRASVAVTRDRLPLKGLLTCGCGPKGIRTPDLLAARQALGWVSTCGNRERAGHSDCT